MELSNLNIKNGLCISLGANIDSKYGTPIESLLISKPKVEKIINGLINKKSTKKKEIIVTRDFNWSSLYKTSPHGISGSQPDYINCILLVTSNLLPKASIKKAKYFLDKFKQLEYQFGREAKSNEQRWLPRCLDIDILWWDNLNINDQDLILPHPRYLQRNFVIYPLSEVLSKSQKIEKLNDKRWII